MFQGFLGAAALCSVAFASDTKFLLMSSTRLSKVSYVVLPVGGPDSLQEPLKPQPLIEVGLKSPGGICWHPAKKTLYVADGAAQAIYKYQLGFSGNTMHIVGKQETAAVNLGTSKWVACDVMGNLYYTDEDGKRIMKVDTQNVMRGKSGEKPLILYSAATVTTMGAPNGIVADNFGMYWVDDVGGKGAVLTGLLAPPDTGAASTVRTIAMTDNAVDGVCITPNNLFFTGTDETATPPKGIVYGMRKAGDRMVTEVSTQLKGPGGCTWDGDGTVYVADSVGNAVVAVPSNMGSLITQYKTTTAVLFEDATSLLVVSGAPQGFAITLAAIATVLIAQI